MGVEWRKRQGGIRDTERFISIIAGNDSVSKSYDKNGSLDGFIFTGSLRPEQGFHFGYFFYLPIELREIPVLIVEGPAVSEVGPLDKAREIVYAKAAFELSTGGFPHYLAQTLRCPIMMPLFPRPEDKENNIFTHALTSKAMSVSNSPVARVDLQLIAMFQDIRNRFLRVGVNMYDKFIVKGFPPEECLRTVSRCFIRSMFLRPWEGEACIPSHCRCAHIKRRL